MKLSCSPLSRPLPSRLPAPTFAGKWEDDFLRAVSNQDTAKVLGLLTNPTLKSQLDTIRDGEGNTGLMLAVKAGDVDLVKSFVKAGANVNAANHKGYTSLVFAIEEKNPAMVKTLIQLKADVNASVGTPHKTTPLILAAFDQTNVETVKLLIKAKANLNARDTGGNTALMLAAHIGKTEIVQELLNAGADKSLKNNSGITALQDAHGKAVKALLRG